MTRKDRGFLWSEEKSPIRPRAEIEGRCLDVRTKRKMDRKATGHKKKSDMNDLYTAGELKRNED